MPLTVSILDCPASAYCPLVQVRQIFSSAGLPTGFRLLFVLLPALHTGYVA
jgi:hypothetical protein